MDQKGSRFRNAGGIAALELMVVVVALLAAATVTVPLFLQKMPFDREGLTQARLQAIKQAILGDPLRLSGRARTDFGFVGDLGVLPTTLAELMANVNGRPVFGPDPGGRPLHFGWRGPYLNSAQVAGAYVSLLDGWGNAFRYLDSNGAAVASMAAVAWPVVLRSAGANGLFNDGDDLTLTLAANEAWSYVIGDFWNRTKTAHITEGQVTAWFPDGSAALRSQVVTTSSPNQTYSTQTDTVSDSAWRRLPVGVRYLETRDNSFRKLVCLNGGGATGADRSRVDFRGSAAFSAPDFELTFDASDNTANNPRTVRQGSWQLDGSGNLVALTNGENRVYFGNLGNPLWQDYRVEVNATLLQGRGYGIYYRADAQTNVNGYCFQFDPGLYSGGATAGVSLVVRRVYNGGEQAPFQQVDYSNSAFSSTFGSGILNTSHQISITVQGNHHIIKLDGVQVLNFTDGTFTTGNAGLRSWDGQSFTRFHHLLVYGIPPLSGGELAWWSFEEGDRNVAYGSGFLIGAVENNGTLANATRAATGVFGRCLSFNDNGRVTVADAAILRPAAQFSLEAWANTTDANDNNDAVVAFKGVVGTRGLGIFYNHSNSPTNGGWLGQVQTATGLYQVCWTDTRPAENTWYHLVVSYDGTYLRIYVDGILKSSTVCSGAITASADSLLIGDSFKGVIDEVRYYGRALSTAEVVQRYLRY